MKRVEKLHVDKMRIVSNDVNETYKASCCILDEMKKKGFSEINVLTALCICAAEYAIHFPIDKREFLKKMDHFWEKLMKI